MRAVRVRPGSQGAVLLIGREPLMAIRARYSLIVLATATILSLTGCSLGETTGGDSSGTTRDLTVSELATADWLGRAYSSSGDTADVFFAGFMMTDSAFYKDTQAWRCIFEGVVAALGTPETQGTLDDLVALSEIEPGFPLSHRDEVEEILAALPKSERMRLGGVVIAAAEQCSHVRVSLFGSGGPVPVCVYDRTDIDQKTEIVAWTMGAVHRERWRVLESGGIEEIAQGCIQEVTEAYESGNTLDWVEDLEQRYSDRRDSSTTTTNPHPVNSSASAPPPEPRSTAAPEWVGVELGRVSVSSPPYWAGYVDLRTTPATPLELFGGQGLGKLSYGEPFYIEEYYAEGGMNHDEPGDRILFMTKRTEHDTATVLDAINVSQQLNERLIQCEPLGEDGVLSLVYGLPENSGVTFIVIDAWIVSTENGFEPADMQTVHCPSR